MQVFHSYAEVQAAVGREVAVTPWHTITQPQIQQFADATGDHQWIHTDPERAAQGPFGAPIAHGFLTLSLLPRFLEESFAIEGATMGLNYGLNRVRFMSPVRVDSRVRGRLHLQEATPIEGGLQMVWRVTTEIEGQDKPACVAESVIRSFGAPA